MSILKHILSPFIEFSEEGKKDQNVNNGAPSVGEQPAVLTTSAPTPVPPVQAPSLPITSSPASTSSPSAPPGSSASYSKHFDDLITDANANNPAFQGIDFKEFVDSKMDVESIADEETRYKTAFTVLKRVGLTRERLVSTGKEYLNIIESDLKGFENAYAQQYKTNVEQKELLLQKKAEELQELNKRIAAINQDVKQLSDEIVQSKEKLNANRNLFISAGEDKKKEIQTELQKIDQYFL
jgi:hypothetical protein